MKWQRWPGASSVEPGKLRKGFGGLNVSRYYKGSFIFYYVLNVGLIICSFSIHLCFTLSKIICVCFPFNQWRIKTLFRTLGIRHWFSQTVLYLVRAVWLDHAGKDSSPALRLLERNKVSMSPRGEESLPVCSRAGWEE